MPTKKKKAPKKKTVKRSSGKGVKRQAKPKVASTRRKKFNYQTPKGMHDILPEEWRARAKLYQKASDILEFYGFSRIETPIAEERELFVRTVGENTDIVEKEMYGLATRSKTGLVLRPELTAPIVRSYLEHGMHKLPQPQRLYCISQAFRHESPQAGRYRQFWQVGAEVLGGESDPIYDAQIITIFYRLLESLRLGQIIVGVNSIGSVADRQTYKKKLVDHYRKSKDICKDCERRLKSNPLRVLDCKNKVCQETKEGAPIILDNLSNVSKTHFKQVLEYLDDIELPYTLKPHLVRGLDYYNRTVFEIYAEGAGREDLSLVAGGRYDQLAESLGGRPTPAVGAAMGVERVLELLMEKDPEFGSHSKKRTVYLIHVGQLAKKKALTVLEDFRTGGVNVLSNLGKSSLSNQLETANKLGASLALILGQKEVFEESIIIRDMDTGAQETVPLSKVVDEVKKRLK